MEHEKTVALEAFLDGNRSRIRCVWPLRCLPHVASVIHMDGTRLYEQLAMMAHSKTEREGWERTVLGFLWRGHMPEVLSFVGGLLVLNGKKQSELVGYLQKHADQIIDYERRRAAGKWIGSGCMEKAVDQVIGMRQKKKGMSWTQQGSQTLAALKIAELNGQWDQLFAA